MDDAMTRMAARVAGGPAPESDPLFELEGLVAECGGGMASVAAGVGEGRLSEESMSRLWRSLHEKARGACESLRSCKSEINSVLPRARLGRQSARAGRIL